MENYRILVVDDEKVIREFLRDFLSDQGYETDLATDGKEALDKIKRLNYDLVITDIKMPNADGIEVLKKVKRKNSNTEVIIITGYPSLDTEAECKNFGAAGYIVKPFQINQIKLLVGRALKSKKPV